MTMALTSAGVACSMSARASTTASSLMGGSGASSAGSLVSGACGASGRVSGGGGIVSGMEVVDVSGG